jgi:hypothetical protein
MASQSPRNDRWRVEMLTLVARWVCGSGWTECEGEADRSTASFDIPGVPVAHDGMIWGTKAKPSR